jgi:agmatine deiminase
MKEIQKLSAVFWHKNGLLLILFFSFLFESCTNNNVQGPYIPIAEFEDQETTFLCWDPQFEDLILRITTLITRHDHVTIFYNEQHHKPEYIKSLLKQKNVALKNVSFTPFKLEKDNIWIRDYGPVFMKDETEKMGILSFKYPHEDNQEFNAFSEQYSSRMQIPFLKSEFFSAGGGREINGKGTIILIEGYEKFINPGMTIAEIESEYKQKMNQKHIIWLKHGIPQDDAFDNGPVQDNIYGNGVNWHVDEFCRFADAETILLAKVDSADMLRDDYYRLVNDRLEECFEILSTAKDQDGNPFTIIRVPQAPVIFAEGQYNQLNIIYTPVTSYLNYILTNQSVVIPSYYRIGDPEFIKEKDELARKSFQEVFKTRNVVMINSLDLNYRGGGLHCITLSKPKLKNKRFSKIFESRKVG